MKFSRIIWLIAVGIFVYWGAAYDTLGNFIERAADKLTAIEFSVETGNGVLAKFEHFITKVRFNNFVNKFLLALSCLALVLSIAYYFILHKAATARDTVDEICMLITQAIIAVLLTLFGHNSLHWWTIITVHISCFLIVYPLYYIPLYKYFKWLVAMVYDILVLSIGGIFIAFYTDEPNTLTYTILFFITCALACVYYLTHRKLDHCPSCNKYISIASKRIIDSERTRTIDGESWVATQRVDTYKVDSNGQKKLIKSIETGWKKVYYKYKEITTNYTDHLSCPNCGHKWRKSGKEVRQESA